MTTVTYHIYYNWRAKKNHGTLHKSNCGDCNYGQGKISNSAPGRNSVWIGPFVKREYAQHYLTRFETDSLCKRCNP